MLPYTVEMDARDLRTFAYTRQRMLYEALSDAGRALLLSLRITTQRRALLVVLNGSDNPSGEKLHYWFSATDAADWVAEAHERDVIAAVLTELNYQALLHSAHQRDRGLPHRLVLLNYPEKDAVPSRATSIDQTADAALAQFVRDQSAKPELSRRTLAPSTPSSPKSAASADETVSELGDGGDAAVPTAMTPWLLHRNLARRGGATVWVVPPDGVEARGTTWVVRPDYASGGAALQIERRGDEAVGDVSLPNVYHALRLVALLGAGGATLQQAVDAMQRAPPSAAWCAEAWAQRFDGVRQSLVYALRLARDQAAAPLEGMALQRVLEVAQDRLDRVMRENPRLFNDEAALARKLAAQWARERLVL